jgi:hypothetical protein
MAGPSAGNCKDSTACVLKRTTRVNDMGTFRLLVNITGALVAGCVVGRVYAQDSLSKDPFVLEVDKFPASLKKTSIVFELPHKPKNAEYALSARKQLEAAKQALLKNLSLTESQLAKATELLNTLHADRQELNIALKTTRPKSSIKAMMDKIDSLNQELDQFFPRYEIGNLFISLAKSYCGACLDYIPALEKRKLVEIIEFAKFLIQQSAPETCSVRDGVFRLADECEKALNYCADYLGLQSSGGGLFIEVVEKDLRIAKKSVGSLDEYDVLMHFDQSREKMLKAASRPQTPNRPNYASEYLFALCRDLDAQGIAFTGKPTYYADVLEVEPLFDSSFWPISYDGIRDCMNKAPSRKKLDAMHELVGRGVSMASYYYGLASEVVTRCQSNARETCSDFRIVSSKVLHTYTTVSGKSRTVSVADIERDLRMWESLGVEDGEKVAHSELLQRLKVCQSAHDHGYW